MGQSVVSTLPEWWEDDVLTRQKLIKGIKAGDIWLNKVKYEGTKRIRGNVCLEVYLPSRGTCLLQHLNCGQTSYEDLPKSFRYGMQELCELHAKNRCWRDWRIPRSSVDRQVGLGCWVSQISCGDTASPMNSSDELLNSIYPEKEKQQ